MIFAGSANRNTGELLGDNGARGDLMIRGLWTRQTECILDVRITNLDAQSYLNRDSIKVLQSQAKEKRLKYLEACKRQRRDFSSFVVSTDGLLDGEASEVLNKLGIKLANKWDAPYAHVIGFIRARISIAIARATNSCVRGTRVNKRNMSFPFPHWEDGTGIKLFRTF